MKFDFEGKGRVKDDPNKLDVREGGGSKMTPKNRTSFMDVPLS